MDVFTQKMRIKNKVRKWQLLPQFAKSYNFFLASADYVQGNAYLCGR